MLIVDGEEIKVKVGGKLGDSGGGITGNDKGGVDGAVLQGVGGVGEALVGNLDVVKAKLRL